MIFSTIEGAAENDVRAERMHRALEYLRTTDLAALPCGRSEIMGDEVFANVMEFDTVAPSEKDFEAHRRYADIHVCIEGTERICVASMDEVEPVGAFSEKDDFGLFRTLPAGREQWITLVPGDILVTYPADAHKPGCHAEGESPSHLKKACVKVLVA